MSIGLRTLLSVRRYQTARDLQYRRYRFACFDVAPVRFAGAMGTSEMRANNRKIYMLQVCGFDLLLRPRRPWGWFSLRLLLPSSRVSTIGFPRAAGLRTVGPASLRRRQYQRTRSPDAPRLSASWREALKPRNVGFELLSCRC